MRGNTKAIALCGIISALSIAVMFIGNTIEVFDLTATAFSTFLIFLIIKFYGYKWGISTYFSIAFLSAIFFFGNFIFILFITLGIYPLIKCFFEQRIKSKKLLWFIKILLFNLSFTILLFWGYSFLFPRDINKNILIIEVILSYPIGNIFIVLYDIVCDKIVTKYRRLIFNVLHWN